MKINKLFLFLFFFNINSAFVTYELTGGRLGDHLLSLLHAKWISYKYNLPMLYRNFDYSNQFEFSNFEQKYDNLDYKKTILLDKYNLNNIEVDKDVIYIVPYFSEDLTEYKNNPNWIYFDVSWEEKNFKEIVKKSISPIDKSLLLFDLPKETINVAVHIRRGGGYDQPLLDDKVLEKRNIYADVAAPLKFPPLSFYVSLIKYISHLIKHKSMYVYIFTDERDTEFLLRRILPHFDTYKNIKFDCRKQNNAWNLNVLNDFFAMSKFDYLIRPQSNFSIVASKLADKLIDVYPSSFRVNHGFPDINKFEINFKTEKIECDYNDEFKKMYI